MSAVAYTAAKITVELGTYDAEVWTALSNATIEYVQLPDGEDVVTPHELREIGFAIQRAVLTAKEDPVP